MIQIENKAPTQQADTVAGLAQNQLPPNLHQKHTSVKQEYSPPGIVDDQDVSEVPAITNPRMDVFNDLTKRGFKLIPVETRGKKPWDFNRNCGLMGWTQKTLSQEETLRILEQNPTANAGVLTGEKSSAVVLDFDTPETFFEWKESHPDALNTFMVKRDNAPEGKLHLYFSIPENLPAPKSTKTINWDFQSDGKQVVAPGSIHTTGGTYCIINDVPLLPWRDEYLPKDATQKIVPVGSFTETRDAIAALPESLHLAIANGAKEGLRNSTLLHIACQLRDAGLSHARATPFALEFGGNCTPPMEGKEVIATIASVFTRPPRDKASKQSGNDVEKSCLSDANFVLENAREMASTGKFFILNNKLIQVSGNDLITPTPAGLCVDILPKRRKKGKPFFSEITARRLLESDRVKKLFPTIMTKSDVLQPYQANGLLKFTESGYNPAHKVWTPPNAIPVCRIPRQAAVDLLQYILQGFCFLEPALDIARTLLFLITPMLMLLTNNCRSMIFHICGNRPGLGKDYLLALAPIIYTGRQAAFYPPPGSDEEFRKMLLAACVAAEPFILISNLKGHLDSPALEQASTSLFIKGRVLGKTELTTAPNLALYGLSSNDGTISPDMERRVIDVRLLYLEEDVNQRIFKFDLHEYLLENRASVLTALYSLVIHWGEQGFPLTGTIIPSFVKWSEIASSILVANGFQNPFDKRKVIVAALEVSGNREDRDFAALLECWYNGTESKTLPSCRVRSIATQHELFTWLDLNERSGQVAFAAILRQRAMRVFRGFRLSIIRGKASNYTVEKVVVGDLLVSKGDLGQPQKSGFVVGNGI